MYNQFKAKLENAIKQNKAFVLIRLPVSNIVQLWVDDNKKSNQKIKLHSFNSEETLIITDDNFYELNLEQFNFSNHLDLPLNHTIPVITKDQYLKTIQQTIDYINDSNKVEKIVVGRPKIETKKISPLESFKSLALKNKNALVYLWHNPNQQTWLAATPELLLKVEQNNFKTVALASTKLPNKNWSEKEKIEQQLVTEYILDVFKGYVDLKVDGPHTVSVGNFDHLKTYISGKLSENEKPNLLVSKLHPTPAICGLPRLDSFNFINQIEGYNRSFYTGYIGLEQSGSSEYYVNLRCAQLFANEVVAYVGGGILANSNPLDEWEETELKSSVILNALV